jgi:hypothetical protein
MLGCLADQIRQDEYLQVSNTVCYRRWCGVVSVPVCFAILFQHLMAAVTPVTAPVPRRS